MNLHLIMPMGGGGTRFGNVGYESPKPLIEIYGKPFFFWATQSIAKEIELASLTFVVLQNHIDRFKIDKKIKSYYSNAKIVVIPEVLPGAVMTCLAGVKNIPNNQPILFNDCDHMFKCTAWNRFCKDERFDELEGGLLTFRSDDPRFSFVAHDNNGFVKRTVEKEVISHDAICGAYYFRSRNIFETVTERYLKNCSYSEYFISGVYNEMAKMGYKIKTFNTDFHVSFGTPEEYEQAKSNKSYIALAGMHIEHMEDNNA